MIDLLRQVTRADESAFERWLPFLTCSDGLLIRVVVCFDEASFAKHV